MDTLQSGAPFVFDITGGMVALLVIGFFYGTAQQRIPQGDDPRLRFYTGRCSAVACFGISAYIGYYLAWGMGGTAPLIRYLLSIPTGQQVTWTVWATLIPWALITAMGIWFFVANITKQMPARVLMPNGKNVLLFLAAGSAYLFGIFVPTNIEHTLLWQGAFMLNFVLALLYISIIAESFTGLVLAIFAGQGTGKKKSGEDQTWRNRPMIPANQAPKSWWQR